MLQTVIGLCACLLTLAHLAHLTTAWQSDEAVATITALHGCNYKGHPTWSNIAGTSKWTSVSGALYGCSQGSVIVVDGSGFDRLDSFVWQLAVGSEASCASCRVHNDTRMSCELPWLAASQQSNHAVLPVRIINVDTTDGVLSNEFDGVVYPTAPVLYRVINSAGTILLPCGAVESLGNDTYRCTRTEVSGVPFGAMNVHGSGFALVLGGVRSTVQSGACDSAGCYTCVVQWWTDSTISCDFEQPPALINDSALVSFAVRSDPGNITTHAWRVRFTNVLKGDKPIQWASPLLTPEPTSFGARLRQMSLGEQLTAVCLIAFLVTFCVGVTLVWRMQSARPSLHLSAPLLSPPPVYVTEPCRTAPPSRLYIAPVPSDPGDQTVTPAHHSSC